MADDKMRLSALMDGEEHWQNKDLNQCSHDSDHAECWARYHLVRDVMQENCCDDIDIDISEAVSAAIKDDPVILAPKLEISSQIQAPASAPIQRAWRKPAMGFAVAASAALLSLGVLQWQFPIIGQSNKADSSLLSENTESEAQKLNQEVLYQTAGRTVGADQLGFVASEQSFSVSTGNGQSPVMVPYNRQELNRYVTQHLEQDMAYGLAGVVPLSRLISADDSE